MTDLLSEDATPVMRQYAKFKGEHKDKILLFRMGDFYEMFGEDAVISSKILNIQLTYRHKKAESPIPMCGIPVHSLDKYVYRLISHGHKVAVCDQMEDSSQAKGLVRRDVTRIMTPGTAFEDTQENLSKNNFICSVQRDAQSLAVAFCDFSTGELELDVIAKGEPDARLYELLGLYRPNECLLRSYGEQMPPWQSTLRSYLGSQAKAGGQSLHIEERSSYDFDPERCRKVLQEHFKVNTVAVFGIPDSSAAYGALGSIILYLKETQKVSPDHIASPKLLPRAGCMLLDELTTRNLEVFESASPTGIDSSLFNVLNKTATSMGSRMLRRYLGMPLVEAVQISRRHDALAELIAESSTAWAIAQDLGRVGDWERTAARLAQPGFSPRDALALRRCLEGLPRLLERMGGMKSELLKDLHAGINAEDDVREDLLRTLAEEPALKLTEGGVINNGISPELDRLRQLRDNGHQQIADMEAAERKRTGVANLKIKYNRVFGYFIELSNSNKHQAPDDYIRRQTLANGERFITPDLKDLEESLLSAEGKAQKLEEELFLELHERIRPAAARMLESARCVAELDVLLSLARVSHERNYCRPEVSDDPAAPVSIQGGRHPVVEAIQGADEPFVPNDLHLTPQLEFIHLLTGPNMGGKSTFMRQNALIVLLAQAGCYVPAKSASLPLFDRIFTRVGASDNLAKGQSTFMMEMNETAAILNQLTERSLVVLDEIGRGTGTYDGMGLARAITEYLHERRAMTLFATHYHELARLESELPGLRNFQVAVNDTEGDVVFLRKIVPGAAGKSYGIHVAELAGLPAQVIDRAREILGELEDSSFKPIDSGSAPDELHEPRPTKAKSEIKDKQSRRQLDIFAETNTSVIVSKIEKFDLNTCSPLDALNFLNQLKKELI